MGSLITNHFPIVRFENGVRKWFNPVTRTRAADRPEERVRLRMIEYLVREAGFSANRMSTEPPVPMQSTDHAGRADILCFDEFHRPLLLVECKAESVKLTEQTAVQAARYNRQIRAPYILLTNGVRDLLFAIQEDGNTRYVADFTSVFPLVNDGDSTDNETTKSMNSANMMVTHGERTRRVTQTGENSHPRPRPLLYWQERGLWSTKERHDTPSTHEEHTLASFLTRFWTTSAFGESMQFIPVTDSQIAGITGTFVRTLKTGSGHLAAGIFADAAGHLWLLHAIANSSENTTIRYKLLRNTDISLLCKFSGITDIIYCN